MMTTITIIITIIIIIRDQKLCDPAPLTATNNKATPNKKQILNKSPKT